MRSTTKTVRIPVALVDAVAHLRKRGGALDDYPSDNATLVGLLRYAIAFPRRHTLTAAIARLTPAEQDRIDDFLCRAARDGIDIAAALPKPATAQSLLGLAEQ